MKIKAIVQVVAIILLFSGCDTQVDQATKANYQSGQYKAGMPYKSRIKPDIRKVYYESGQLKAETPYVDGVIEGTYKSYYESGQLESERIYRRDGSFTTGKMYYENGQLKAERIPGNNSAQVFEKYYYESGKLGSETSYINGVKDGICKTYRENGNVQCEMNYKDGKQVGILKEYYESGKLKSETTLTDGKHDGVDKRYYENGRLRSETPYITGKREGVEKVYYVGGQLLCETIYKNGVGEKPYENGVKEGVEKWYYLSGQLQAEVSYKNNLEEGTTKIYKKDGSLEFLETFKAGRKTKKLDSTGVEKDLGADAGWGYDLFTHQPEQYQVNYDVGEIWANRKQEAVLDNHVVFVSPVGKGPEKQYDLFMAKYENNQASDIKRLTETPEDEFAPFFTKDSAIIYGRGVDIRDMIDEGVAMVEVAHAPKCTFSTVSFDGVSEYTSWYTVWYFSEGTSEYEGKAHKKIRDLKN